MTTEPEQRVQGRQAAAAALGQRRAALGLVPDPAAVPLPRHAQDLLWRPRTSKREGVATAFDAIAWWGIDVARPLMRQYVHGQGEVTAVAAQQLRRWRDGLEAADWPAWTRLWRGVLDDGITERVPDERTATNPRVYFCRLTDAALLPLLEYSPACVLKGQPVTPDALALVYEAGRDAEVGNLWYADEAPLLGITNDAALGRLVTRLTRDWPIPVTPHYAALLDTFVGPSLTPTGAPDPLGWPCLYLLQERGTLSFYDHLREVSRERDVPQALRHAEALFFTIVHAIDGAHAVLGLAHGDMRAGNIMVRSVATDAFYAGRPWAYQARGQRNVLRVVAAAEHRDTFVEIIDLGRGSLGAPRRALVGDLRRLVRSMRWATLRAAPEWQAYVATLSGLVHLDHDAAQEKDYDPLPEGVTADAIFTALYARAPMATVRMRTATAAEHAALVAARTVLVGRVPSATSAQLLDTETERVPKRKKETPTATPTPSPPKVKRARTDDAVLEAVHAGILAVRAFCRPGA